MSRPLFLVTRQRVDPVRGAEHYTVARFNADDPITLLAAVQARVKAGQTAKASIVPASIVPGNEGALLMLLEVSAGVGHG